MAALMLTRSAGALEAAAASARRPVDCTRAPRCAVRRLVDTLATRLTGEY